MHPLMQIILIGVDIRHITQQKPTPGVKNMPKLFRIFLALCSLALTLLPPQVSAQADSASTGHQQIAAERDGQHDFDFDIGVWKTHIRRTLDPLSSSRDFIELNGTVTVRKVWGGRAQLEEIETDGPNGHWEGMSLFLYNPQSHQWSQTFANGKVGVLTTPLIGRFTDGRGELYAQDTINGRSILVRAIWSAIAADSHQYEESYSDDGGKTWVRAFIANLTRGKS
jgi:hypothetical protein